MSKRIKIEIDGQEIELTEKQKRFCEIYVSKEFFANGVQSYMEAYSLKPDKYYSAKENASRLLTNVDILLYINHLMDLSGLNDEFVDKQITMLITQNADFGSKLGAIKEYNRLRQRIIDKQQSEVTHKFEGFGFLPNGTTNTK